MRIRALPDNIPFVEALITFLNLYPTDNFLYGLMIDTFSVPNDFRSHLQQTYGYGSREAWIKLFEWAVNKHSMEEMKYRMHQAICRSGQVLTYRTFIRDYRVFLLKPEFEDIQPTTCWSFLCSK